MATDLAHAYAVVVGCEDYPMDRWALNGPVFDALDIGKWLLETGMPEHHLHLLTSPLPQNQAAFDAALASMGAVVNHGAVTSDMVKEVFKTRVLRAIKKDGSLKSAGQLLVFWSGHGIVQRHQTGFDRIVFCSDVEPDVMECVSIPAIVDWLSSQLPSFQLIFLIDACASESSRLGVDARLSFVGLPRGTVSRTPNQFLAYAAYPGQVARNQSGNQRGLFTDALMTHLKYFRPASLPEFRDIARVVDLARQTVNAASAGRQSVAWDQVGWEGNRSCPASDAAAWRNPEQAPPSESAAVLCNRKRQWADFERMTKIHQRQHPRCPMVVVTHGQRDQDCSAFLANLSHRAHKGRLWAGSVSTVDHLLVLDHWSDMAEAELDEHLTARLGELLQMPPPLMREDLAARISARRSTWMVMIPIESRLLRNNSSATLAPLLRFWRAFPDVADGALIVFIHIEYPAAPRSRFTRWLSKLRDPDGAVRQLVARQEFSVTGVAPIVCLPTELGMVTVDDVAAWAKEIHSIHRSWTPPTEREIQALFNTERQRAMDEILKHLAHFIQKGKAHVSNQAY